MKLGVIGEPCIDFIHRGKSVKNKQLGGILYSLVSLAVLAGKKGEVYPVFNLGADEFEFIISFLSKFENIRTDFINKSLHKTRVVNLYYNEPENYDSKRKKTYEREESSTEPALPVDYGLISKALPELDGLFINMVSGTDITLGSLKQIRKDFINYIHMDFHNVVMITNKDGTRVRKPVTEWLEWCSQSDTLQMNETEISVMHEEKMNEYETAEIILSTASVKALIVTKGSDGACIYQRTEKQYKGEKYHELDKIDVQANERNDFKDSTGCGDVFGTAFFYKNMMHTLENKKDFYSSLNFANKMAGINSSLSGVEELHKLI